MTSQKGIKMLVSLETAFRIPDTEKSTSLGKTETPPCLPSMVPPAQPAPEPLMIPDSWTWPQNRKTRCEYGDTNMASLFYNDASYGKRLHVLSSMVPSTV